MKQQDRENNPKMPSNEVVEQFESESCYGKDKATLSIIVQGASDDLAKKMKFPALFDLCANGFVPANSILIGCARSDTTDDDLRDQLEPFLKEKMEGIHCGEETLDRFLKRIRYVQGGSNEDDMQGLVDNMSTWEKQEGGNNDNVSHNRLYYFAIPPSVFLGSAAAIKAKGVSETEWTRLVAEKPFGRDLDSAQELTSKLKGFFTEDHIYHIDHYLCQEMVQNMLTIRFGNVMLEPIWNRSYIESVSFNFKEDI